MVPEYIPVSQISSQFPEYEWDEWDPYAPLGEHDEQTMDVLAKVTDRGIIAYSIGCAEWVVYRLSPYFDDERPYRFLEACWAFEMEKGYEAPKPFNEHEWQGKIRGAVELSLVTILNSYYLTEEEGAEVEAALAELIVLHVMADTTPFLNWRSKILPRLASIYPRNSSDVWGEPIPRQFLDPSKDMGRDERLRMVREFLDGLSSKENDLLYYSGEDNSQ